VTQLAVFDQSLTSPSPPTRLCVGPLRGPTQK
jgi:hypothetical protein